MKKHELILRPKQQLLKLLATSSTSYLPPLAAYPPRLRNRRTLTGLQCLQCLSTFQSSPSPPQIEVPGLLASTRLMRLRYRGTVGSSTFRLLAHFPRRNEKHKLRVIQLSHFP